MSSEQLTVPKFGVSTESVGISEWLKEVGEEIQAGDPVVLVETDKATVEIEATVGGTLAAQLAPVGAELNVGDPYAEVTVVDGAPVTQAKEPSPPAQPKGPPSGEPVGDPPAAPPEVSEAAEEIPATSPSAGDVGGVSDTAVDDLRQAPAPPASELPAVPTPQSDPSGPSTEATATGLAERGKTEIRATPSARALAKAHGLDLEAVTGSGPQARIRRSDVARMADAATHQPAKRATNGLWGYTVSVPMPTVSEAGNEATTLADLMVMAVDLALDSSSSSGWQAVRLRKEGDEMLLERREFANGQTESLTPWEPIDPAALSNERGALTVVVSDLPSLSLDIPATGTATMTVAAPADPGGPLTVVLRFDPGHWELGRAYGLVREVGRLLGSPVDLAAGLWARSRTEPEPSIGVPDGIA